ncbi:MAG: LLM class flavin-dependent oxidoreductase [Gammaproteobacteria bacterium]|nr:MAG: LLM class flavin-dependent oxidoreductase [Gammaproteobacteria bacterium]
MQPERRPAQPASSGVCGLNIFSTCPQSKDSLPGDYVDRVVEVAEWSETAGYSGILVYTDNSLVDPWMVSQEILKATSQLSPLVAVQPIYMHPYAVAKMVASLAFLYERKIYLNMLAGGFVNDLKALGDETPHDDRYARTGEYTRIVRGVLEAERGFSFSGQYYRVAGLRMAPPVPEALRPGILLSGSSPAGLACAEEVGATAIRYPQPPSEEPGIPEGSSIDFGVRVGVIARESAEAAWAVAHARFPDDRHGELRHQLAMKVSDSHWHRQLSGTAEEDADASVYWLHPFKSGKTFCPYLVGSHAQVGALLRTYVQQGFRTFILDIPPDREEVHHTGQAFRLAAGGG